MTRCPWCGKQERTPAEKVGYATGGILFGLVAVTVAGLWVHFLWGLLS